MTKLTWSNILLAAAQLKPRIRIIYCFAGFLLLALLVFQFWQDTRNVAMFIPPDGEEYLAYTKALLGGNWQQLFAGKLAFRTPGYPLLLILGRSLFGSSSENVRYLHALIGIFVLIAVSINLRSIFHPLATSILLCLLFHFTRVFYLCILSEWSAICFIVLLLSLFIRYQRAPSTLAFFLCALCSSWIVLIRPAAIPVMIVPALLLCVKPGTGLIRRAAALAIAVLPLMLWSGLNYHKHGTLSLTPRNGFCLFILTTVIGDVSYDKLPTSSDSRTFAEEFQKRRQPPPDPASDPSAVERVYNRNMWEVAETIRNENGWTIQKLNEISSGLALEVLREHPFTYLSFITREFGKQVGFTGWPFWCSTLTLLLLQLTGRRGENQRILFYSACLFLGIHLIHMALCVSLVHMLYRFFAVTYYPLCFSLALLAYSHVTRLLGRASSS